MFASLAFSRPPGRHLIRLAPVAGFALAAIVAVGCARGVPPDASPVPADEVSVVDSAYEAPVIRVVPGTTVTWTWRGSLPHDVAGEGWSSEVQQQGTYRHTFDTPGTFDYRCHVHDGMAGRVIVDD